MKNIAVKDNITIDDVEKLDIRVGEILKVSDVENSNKLIKLDVDFGEFQRVILVGMKGEREDPTEIEGMQALFVVNLAPRKLAGIISEGMLFDIGYANGIIPVLALPEKEVPNGACAG